MSDYLLALDVGGTKTDGVLFTPDGTVLRHVIFAGANPLDLGLEEAMSRYMKSIHALCGNTAHLKCLYVGGAAAMYFGSRIPDYLKTQVSADKLRVESDGPALISAMLGHADGASLICGTGSSLTIRKGDEYDTLGGWGYLIDGCASGFILGKQAVLAAVREHDGRGEKTIISDLLKKRLGAPATDSMAIIYSGGRPFIASLAGVVFEARKAGDAVAARIFDACIADLGELVHAAYRRLGGAYSLVLNGGIFRSFPEYVQALKDQSPTDVHMIDSDAPPIYGCAVEAMWDAGLSCDEPFKKRFMAGYNA